VDAGQVRCFSEEPLPMEILALSIKATASN
jgi:hypothetical protein